MRSCSHFLAFIILPSMCHRCTFSPSVFTRILWHSPIVSMVFSLSIATQANRRLFMDVRIRMIVDAYVEKEVRVIQDPSLTENIPLSRSTLRGRLEGSLTLNIIFSPDFILDAQGWLAAIGSTAGTWGVMQLW